MIEFRQGRLTKDIVYKDGPRMVTARAGTLVKIIDEDDDGFTICMPSGVEYSVDHDEIEEKTP